MLNPSDFKPKCKACNSDEAYFSLCLKCKTVIENYGLWRLEGIVKYLTEKKIYNPSEETKKVDKTEFEVK